MPVAVVGLTDATQVSAGGASTCALRAEGTAACWGYNLYGQVGDRSSTDSSVPVAVVGESCGLVKPLAGGAAARTHDRDSCKTRVPSLLGEALVSKIVVGSPWRR